MGQTGGSERANQGVDEAVFQQVAIAAAGDDATFDALIAEHRPGLRNFVELRVDGRLRSRVDASDVVQETVIKAHRQLASFAERRPMPFRIWLMKTALDLIRDMRVKHLKRERRTVEREVHGPDKSAMLLAANLSQQQSPSEVAMHKEKMQTVATLICGMKDRDREVLVLRHIEELKFEEIAALLDMTAAAARKRYARAILRLQQLCSDQGISRI